MALSRSTAPTQSIAPPAVSTPASQAELSSSPEMMSQELQGNAFVNEQMCSQDPMRDPEVDGFLGHGAFGPTVMVPPDTAIGGFDASYDPATGVLSITVQGSMEFKNGLELDSGGVFSATTTDLDQAAIDANNAGLDDAQKQQFLSFFVWNGEQAQWLADMRQRVQDLWSAKYSFYVDKPGWECIMAEPMVNIDVVEGMSRPDDHLAVTTYKVPDDGSYDVGAVVNSDGSGRNSTMVLGSRDNKTGEQRATDSLRSRSVYFDNGSAELDQDAKKQLDVLKVDFMDANADLSNPISLVGRASSSGSRSRNERLGTERARSVASYLGGIGISNTRVSSKTEGEKGADEDAAWRRVDIAVDGTAGQNVAAHEFGHVMGLDDEYDDTANHGMGGSFTGTGKTAGSTSGHDQMAKDIGVSGGAVHENNGGIMSMGSKVAKQHYATFGWALRQLTSRNDWKVL